MYQLYEKLQKHQPAIGTFCHLASPTAVECLSLTGLDYLVLDTEHAPYTEDAVANLIRAMQLHGTAAFVRTRDSSRAAILHHLDAGANGLIIPDVHTVEQVQKLVEYAKFYPTGRRGFAFVRSCDYGQSALLEHTEDYFSTVNRQALLIPQCETADALAQIEEIAAINGVDGIFIGPYDLSIDLGIPAQMTAPLLQDAIITVLNACKKQNKLALIYANDREAADRYFAQGFDAVAIGTDTNILIQAYKTILEK